MCPSATFLQTTSKLIWMVLSSSSHGNHSTHTSAKTVTKQIQNMNPDLDLAFVRGSMYLPAAKCNGVDLRPAVSLAFTVCELINFFTLTMSPVLHASNNSRSGSLAMTASKLTVNSVRLRLDIFTVYPSSTKQTNIFSYLVLISYLVYICVWMVFVWLMEETSVCITNTLHLGRISVADALSHNHIHICCKTQITKWL